MTLSTGAPKVPPARSDPTNAARAQALQRKSKVQGQVWRQHQHTGIGQRLRMARQRTPAAREAVREDGGSAQRSSGGVHVQHDTVAVKYVHLRLHRRCCYRPDRGGHRDHHRSSTHQRGADPAYVMNQHFHPHIVGGRELGRVINQMSLVEQGFRTQTSQTIDAAR
jgi:hypothetical protein